MSREKRDCDDDAAARFGLLLQVLRGAVGTQPLHNGQTDTVIWSVASRPKKIAVHNYDNYFPTFVRP